MYISDFLLVELNRKKVNERQKRRKNRRLHLNRIRSLTIAIRHFMRV